MYTVSNLMLLHHYKGTTTCNFRDGISKRGYHIVEMKDIFRCNIFLLLSIEIPLMEIFKSVSFHS